MKKNELCPKCGRYSNIETDNDICQYCNGFPTASYSLGSTTATINIDYLWNEPILVDTIKNDDSVELVYRQSNKLNFYPMYEHDRVYKIICSCKDGQWHEERVEGIIVAKSDEHYIF